MLHDFRIFPIPFSCNTFFRLFLNQDMEVFHSLVQLPWLLPPTQWIVVQKLSCLTMTPWTAACRASLSSLGHHELLFNIVLCAFSEDFSEDFNISIHLWNWLTIFFLGHYLSDIDIWITFSTLKEFRNCNSFPMFCDSLSSYEVAWLEQIAEFPCDTIRVWWEHFCNFFFNFYSNLSFQLFFFSKGSDLVNFIFLKVMHYLVRLSNLFV